MTLLIGKRDRARSAHWPHVEQMKKRLQPLCQICGTPDCIQIHHVNPFEDAVDAGRPELELCLENLASLCETEAKESTQNCHLIVGHLGNFKSQNPILEVCLTRWKGLAGSVIQKRNDWIQLAAAKPLQFHEMPTADQQAYRANLDAVMPADKITVWDGQHWKRNGAILSPDDAVVPDLFFVS